MKHKKTAFIFLSFISIGVAMLLLSERAVKEQATRLPLPHLSDCQSSEHPVLPKRYRATYLMAPFTTGQLVVGEIVHDGPFSATRITLHGVEHGTADFLVMGEATYKLSLTKTGEKSCTALGDTGWRPLPADWLEDNSRCTGSRPVFKTPVNWWVTEIEPAPSSYWIWTKHSDGTPFRLLFASPTDRLAGFGRFTISHQLAFASVESTGLQELAILCQSARPNLVLGAKGLLETLDEMARSDRADGEIARLVPALKHHCIPPSKTLWPKRLGLTGMLTPFDSGPDPVPMEVIYDWSVPGQRSRIYPESGDAVAHDYLLLQSGGYNVNHRSDGSIICTPGLPGAIRPDWFERAPCECRAEIAIGTNLTLDEPIQIFSCPLNLPRIAWGYYTLSGLPTMFLVTAKPGDEGSKSFAVLDYDQWVPNLPVDPSTFAPPRECPNSPIVPAGIPTNAVANCRTCHSSPIDH